MSAVAKELSEYINDTKDDMGGEMILQLLAKVLPDPKDPSGTKVKVGGTLDETEATKLNDALKVPGVQDNPGVPKDVALDKAALDKILEAVAKRIAADKYTLLKEMVKMGVMRLVIEHEVIETKLTFTTYGSTFYESTKSNYHRDDFSFRAKAKTGGLVSLWVKASASTAYNSVNISTSREANRDISGSQVQIYGHVQIDFKTDYQPMTT